MSDRSPYSKAELALMIELRHRANVEIDGGADAFMNWPDRWWEGGLKRCANDHVSHTVLMSEALGRDACLGPGCRARVFLTFPEDADGPLTVST